MNPSVSVNSENKIPEDDKTPWPLIGYVLMDTPGVEPGMARLLYEGFHITQNWFPVGQCLEYCIDHGVHNPKIYTFEEFIKAIPKLKVSDFDSK